MTDQEFADIIAGLQTEVAEMLKPKPEAPPEPPQGWQRYVMGILI